MAEVKLNEAKYRLLQAQSNFETGRMAFNSLIGIPLQTATEIEATLPIVNPPDSLLHQNRVNRPEIEMAQDRIKIAESNLTLNDSQYKPQLSIGIDGSYSSPGYNFKRDPDLIMQPMPNYPYPCSNGAKGAATNEWPGNRSAWPSIT